MGFVFEGEAGLAGGQRFEGIDFGEKIFDFGFEEAVIEFCSEFGERFFEVFDLRKLGGDSLFGMFFEFMV
jgi:hypothetical protein